MSKQTTIKLTENSIAASLSAIEVYNKTNFPYRNEVFCILFVNAWELLFKARILAKFRIMLIISIIKNEVFFKELLLAQVGLRQYNFSGIALVSMHGFNKVNAAFQTLDFRACTPVAGGFKCSFRYNFLSKKIKNPDAYFSA